MTAGWRRLSLLEWLTLLAVLPLAAFVCYAVLNSSSYLTSPRSTAIYIGGPLLIAGALLASFLLGRATRQVVLISFWSVLAAFYAFEAYLTWSEGREPELPADWDTRSRLEVIAELRAQGTKAFPSVTPKNFHDAGLEVEIDGRRLLPLGGVPNATTVHCNESGRYRIYRSDRYGFANADEVWDQPAGAALIGDSYVQGACVPPAGSMAVQLQRLIPGVLNLGAQGNGPLGELATLREYVAPRRPDVVVWFFYYNDLLQDLFRELSDPVLPKYLDPAFTQELRHKAQPIAGEITDLVERLYEDAQATQRRITMAAAAGDRNAAARDQAHFKRFNPLNYLSGLTLRRTRQRLGLYQGGADWLPPDLVTFRKVLELARAEVNAWGGRFYFAVLPSWDEVMGTDPSYLRRYRLEGLAVAQELGLKTLDLTDTFRSQPDPPALFANRQPNHYSEAGYRLVADTVGAWVSD